MIALLFAAGFAFTFTLFATPLFIKLVKRLQWGQFIRDDGPQGHHSKRGTPTMGGVTLIIGAVLGYFFGHLVTMSMPSATGLLVLLMTVGLGLVGFLDDWIKTHKQRSLGLGGWQKIAGQVLVAIIFGVLALQFPNREGITPASGKISLFRDIPWLDMMAFGTVIGAILFLIWTILITTSASNGVNVADGLDGLATGASILTLSAYIVIGFWKFNQDCTQIGVRHVTQSACYQTRDPLDAAIVAAALVGALIGFLWWNTAPAQIFMGDTGSLGLGGAIAALSIVTHTEILLVLLGGLFVIVAGSVIVQRAYFKITHGKRIFLMSPLHHHFELKGWAEITVVVRFWIIAGVFVSLGVGLFYLEWSIR